MRIAVLGLGEAGSIYAADLAGRGATVTATDPRVDSAPSGVHLAPSVGEAVHGAEIILSLVTGHAAQEALAAALPAMDGTGIFADMNTASPEEKRRLSQRAAAAGIPFGDVAILAPVPRARIDTPLIVSGAAEEAITDRLSALGIPTTGVGPEAGVAAGLKLLRSVFMKGLAATVLEAATAAEAIGAREWVLGQIASELGPSGEALVEHLLESTQRHAVRRAAEMRATRSFLDSLGASSPMTDGTIEWLERLSDKGLQTPSNIVDNLVSDP